MPDTIEERLRKLRAQQSKRPIEERLAALRAQQPPQRPPERSVMDAISGGLASAAGEYLVEPAVSLYEAGKSAVKGDFGPAKNIAESAARGGLGLQAALLGGPGFYRPVAATQAPALTQLQTERDAQLAQTPAGQYVQRRRAQLAEEAKGDVSLTNRLARNAAKFVGAAAPAVATGVLTGGSAPAIAATTALQSAAQPENATFAAAASVLPIPVGQAFRAGVNAVRRAFGKGAAQIVEAEALPAATAQVRQSIGEASPTVQRAMQQFEQEVQRIKSLPPGQQAAEMEAAIRSIGREASGIRPVSEATRRGYPPQMVMPENPNPIQQAGRLPFEAETPLPTLEAELGVSTAPSVSARGASVRGPAAESAALEVSPAGSPPTGTPPPEFTGGGFDRPPIQQPLFDAAARSKWQDTVLAYMRGNWLTNPVGRANDLGQTIINQFPDAVVRPVAAAVDVIVSKLTGSRAITGPSLRGTGRAFGSIRQGLRDAREVLRTGRQAIDSGADDALYGNEIRSGLGKGFDVPVNGVFRLLGALDAPFRRFGYARNLFDRARVAAINEAKRGKIPRGQMSARIRELMEKDDIVKAAVRDGERAVLSESNRFSAWVARQTQNSPNARLAVGLIQPFLRIPANAAAKAADFAGVGGVKALYKIARGGVRKAGGKPFFSDLEEQRVFAQNVAAGSFGVAGFMLGMRLEERGNLEGFFYTSKKDFPNGKVPTSINIGGKNYDVNRLGGFIFAPLFVGATYNRLRKQDAGKANAFLRSFSGLFQQAPVVGYYGAIPKTARILGSDKPGAELAKEAGNTAAGLIPASGLVRATAKAFDLLPGKAPRSATVGAALERNQPLFSELQRLNKRVSELRKKDGEKDDAFQQRVHQFGQNYTQYGLRLLENPRFQAAPDNIKALALDSLNNRAKGVTRRELAPYEIESILDANTIMDAAESSKKNPANK